MRYWSYLAAKIVVATGIFLGLLALLNWWWPAEAHRIRDTLAH